jgi:hypothetical protein
MFIRTAVTVVLTLGLAAQADAQLFGPASTALPQESPKVGQPPPPPPPDLVPEAGGIADHSPERWWITADYLFGWVRSSGLPPLITTSPAGTAQANAGVLGQNTTVVFGDDHPHADVRSGFRLGAGGWFNDERTLGINVGFAMLESQSAGFVASSSGTPILARPFTDVTTGLPTSQLIAFPGVASGSVAASVRSDNFYDVNVDFQEVFLDNGGFRLESLLGYRYLRFSDRLTVDQSVVSAGTSTIAAGTAIQTADSFTAENSFQGVDFGLRTEFYGDRWSVAAVAKIAVGSVHRTVGIAGTTLTTVPGSAPVESAGGMLALSSNSGVHGSSDWVIAPEAGIELGWDVTSNIRLRVGYSFLYWTDVARAGRQVDTNINPNLFPPAPANGALPSNPAFTLQKSDIWIQTLNLGVEFRF